MISTIASTAGGAGLGATIPIAGQVAFGVQQFRNAAPHNTATKFVNEVEAPFDKALAEVVRLKDSGQTEAAQQLFASEYAKYTAGVDQYKNSGISDVVKVANQSLANNALQQTIQTIASQLGVKTGPNGQLTPVNVPLNSVGSTNSYIEGDHNPALTGSGNILSSIANIIPGILGNIPGMQGGVGSQGPVPNPYPNPNPNPAPPPTAGKSIWETLLPGILLGTSVGSNILTSQSTADAAKDAAQIQADAALKAAELQDKTTNRALDLNKQVYDTNLANAQPWLAQGTSAINQLGTEIGLPGTDPNATGYGSLNKPFDEKFNFTTDDLLKDPGYLTRMQASQQAMQRAASAKGGLYTPGVQAAIDAKIGEQGSNEFGVAHDRALNEFLNRYNIYNTDQNTRYNRLAGVAGTGQTAGGHVQNAGTNYSSTAGNESQAGTSAINDLLTSGASATAKGNLSATVAKNAGINNSIDDITSYVAELIRNRNRVV